MSARSRLSARTRRPIPVSDRGNDRGFVSQAQGACDGPGWSGARTGAAHVLLQPFAGVKDVTERGQSILHRLSASGSTLSRIYGLRPSSVMTSTGDLTTASSTSFRRDRSKRVRPGSSFTSRFRSPSGRASPRGPGPEHAHADHAMPACHFPQLFGCDTGVGRHGWHGTHLHTRHDAPGGRPTLGSWSLGAIQGRPRDFGAEQWGLPQFPGRLRAPMLDAVAPRQG